MKNKMCYLTFCGFDEYFIEEIYILFCLEMESGPMLGFGLHKAAILAWTQMGTMGQTGLADPGLGKLDFLN